jgi:predicted ATPase
MDYALMHRVYRRDAKRVLSIASEIIRFAEDQSFSDPESKGLIFHGWAKSVLGDASTGLPEIEGGLLRQRDIGTTEDFPIYHCMLAESYMLAGRIDRAIDVVLQARRDSESTSLEIWSSELWRWLGVLGRLANQDESTVEQCFIEALNIARRQKATMLELRAALELVAFRQERGGSTDVLDLIAPLLKAITGGRDSEEQQRATSFLSELHVAEQ